MTKYDIYIDFEGISAPFNYKLGIKRDVPYAYTLGVYVGKTFKTATYIFNFTKDDISGIDNILRQQILTDVRKLSGQKTFKINSQTTRFIGYSPSYESKLLRTIYRGVEVHDISMGRPISLSNATSHKISDEHYFPEFKKWVAKNIEIGFVEKRGLMHDGALASLAGHILFADSKDLETKFYKNPMDIKTLIEEIRVYSKDDVVRMKVINNNIEEFIARADSVQEVLIEKSKARKQMTKVSRVEEFIASLKPKSLKALKKELADQKSELAKILEKSHKL